MDISCIAIVGLGLIGGSIAKSAKAKLGVGTILASDKDTSVIEDAVSDGIVTGEINHENIQNADIVFICTPVKNTVEEINKLLPYLKEDCIITDVGSTKSDIIAQIETIKEPVRFVGGHPMTGSEQTGYRAGKPHLFENAYYLIVPTGKAEQSDVDKVTEFAKGIGAIPLTIQASEHDKVMAAVSHLPHVAASALVNFLTEFDRDGIARAVAAGGFRDTTRIASGSPVMWEAICMSNSEMIVDCLERYIDVLNGIKRDLLKKEGGSVYSYFDSAKTARDKMNPGVRGDFDPAYDIVVDVEDKPGIIGQVATVLGLSNINIKNMNISNSREFENGVLIVSLSSKDEQEKSYAILKQFHFGVEYKV